MTMRIVTMLTIMRMPMITSMTRARSKILPRKAGEDGLLPSAALFRLMAWLSPAYPVGAFSYSSGLEWAVEAGDIFDDATLRDWLDVVLSTGSGFCDAVLFAHAHRTGAAADDSALVAVAE